MGEKDVHLAVDQEQLRVFTQHLLRDVQALEEITRKTTGLLQSVLNTEPPRIDLQELTDQVYDQMERKIRVERERRGL